MIVQSVWRAGRMGSRRISCPICLLLLSLLLGGAGGWPDVPGSGKDRSKPARAGSRRGRGEGGLSKKGSPDSRGGQLPLPAPKAELGPLAQYFGKFRLLVLAAPDPSDNSYRLMEKQIDVRSRQLSCRLAVRDLLVLVLFHGAGAASPGKLVRFSQEGKVSEEKVQPGEVGQIMRLLSLEQGQFSMVLLKKSMQLFERFPYAVRVEAVLETVDRMPLRKVESMTRRSQQLKCKGGGARRLGPGQVYITNRTLANRSLVNRTPINRSLVNGTLANRSLVNRTLANRYLVTRTLANRSLVNRTPIIRSLVNGTLANRSLVNTSPANTRLRSATPNSQKPIRSPSVRFFGKPAALAPDSGSPSGRMLAKQKGSSSTPRSTGQRRAETLQSPAQAGQGVLGSLMDQIKQKVQQMLAANHGYPIQRRPAPVTQTESRVPGAGSHTYHTPRVQSRGSTPVTSTMARLNPTAARGVQPAGSAALNWDQSQFSTTQQIKDRSSVRAGVFGTNSSTVRSQERFPTQYILGNGSAVPIAVAPHPTESALWDSGSPTAQTTGPGLLPLSRAPGRVSPIPGKATFSTATREESTPASNPESSQARGQQTDPPIGNTLPKSPAHPAEGGTRGETGGTGAEAEQEGGGPGQRWETAPTAPPKGKKLERERGENSGKGARSKGRKNRRNRKNKKGGSRNPKPVNSREQGGFLEHFRNKRRLLLITSPSKDSRLYMHQRDEYLENVCQLAIRRISVISILGSLTNSSLTVEHYQTENELALENPVPESVGADLTAQLRRDYGMTFDEFFMVFVDYDMKVKQYFDVPIPMKVLMDYMDTLPSRKMEIQEEKRNGVTCVKQDSQVNINKFLSRNSPLCPVEVDGFRGRCLGISGIVSVEWEVAGRDGGASLDGGERPAPALPDQRGALHDAAHRQRGHRQLLVPVSPVVAGDHL
uniref:coiled-coil domain-containing protein 80-like isoform X2 n=1 Tax=Pristiophorus japonicus TaxID=55135 RepID=UPI00398F69AB